MRYLIVILLLQLFLKANSVGDYRATALCVRYNNSDYFAIRSLSFNGKKAFLIVDTDSLHTGLVKQEETQVLTCDNNVFNSKYFKLLGLEKGLKHRLQNDGITATNGGIIVTTDLCPSSKRGFEKRLYQTLIDNFKNPVPVTIFITKRWIHKHLNAFKKLKSWQQEGKLDIVWGNHTAEHRYNKDTPIDHNFVLLARENLAKDVLDLEKELLKRGVLPSVFFRFPGLVSDKKSVNIVIRLGLIIVGTNSWLAKGESLKENSIILVHGNKNEAKGVDILLKLIKERKIKAVKSIRVLL